MKLGRIGRRSALICLSAMLAADAVAAQSRAMLELPAYPQMGPLDGTLVRARSLAYRAVLVRGDSIRALGERLVSVLPMQYAGRDAWLLLETTEGQPEYALRDSLIVDRATLHPLRWGSYVDFARIVAEFRADSIFGGLTSPAGRRTMVGEMPSRALVTAAMSEVVLPLLPLASDFRDSVVVAATTPAHTVLLRAEVAVLGEERISVPAGAFDCWVVALTTDAGGPTYWISKRDAMVVRSTRWVPESGGMLVYELGRIDYR